MSHFKDDELMILFFLFSTFFSLSLIPLGIIIKVSAGYFFGFWCGATISLLSILTGSCLSFLISKKFLKDYFLKKFPKTSNRIKEIMNKNSFLTVLRVRLFPFFPFQISNYILGCFDSISLLNFIMASFLGLIPATIFYSYIGSEVSSLEHQPLSYNQYFFLFLILTSIFLLTFIPKLIKKK